MSAVAATVTSTRFAPPDPRAQFPKVLTWNGRLDNRAQLMLRFGEGLAGDASDAALARAVYGKEGFRGLNHLIGDWSLVLADVRRGTIVLATDFSGVRPLYYHALQDRVLWSSHLRALVAAVDARDIDELYVAGFVVYGGYPTRTPYAQIRSVRPGHGIRISGGDPHEEAFWTPPVADRCEYREERRYDEQFQALFREAVAVRLNTNGPVVAELSGGLDSSSVVCMASRLVQSGDVAATSLHTISYVGAAAMDLPFIRDVESVCGLTGVHISVQDAPLFSIGSAAGATPRDHSPLLARAAQVSREHGATAFLTGHGGDLLLGNWLDDSAQVVASIRRGRFDRAVAGALAWSRATSVPMCHILASAVRNSIPRLGHRASHRAELRRTASAASSLAPTLAGRVSGAIHSSPCLSMNAPAERRAHFRALLLSTELHLLQPVEPLQDLALTHPFFHRPLVEFLLTVPAEVLCGPGQPRRLMRRALAGLWTPLLRGRRSKGLFGNAYFEAFRPFAVSLLAQKRWHVVERGWIERASCDARLRRFCDGLECNQAQLRQILLLEHWMRQREDATTPRPPTVAVIDLHHHTC